MARTKYPIHGWLNLNKPLEMTSNQVIGALKRLFSPQKIGHAGTLDPLADGVLPIAFGEATKTVQFMMDASKTYRFTICFGEARNTDDAEGEVVETSENRPSKSDIEAILPQFIGIITQVPPTYSAIKINGKRAYELARKGEEVEMKEREVTIFDLMLEAMPDADHAELAVTCSKGTYIRSLARDIAKALGSVGYVSRLQRTGVGNFCLDDAISLDFLDKMVHNASSSADIALAEVLKSVSAVLDDIPAVSVETTQAESLRHGQKISCNENQSGDLVAIFDGETLVAVGEAQGGWITPKRVFNLNKGD